MCSQAHVVCMSVCMYACARAYMHACVCMRVLSLTSDSIKSKLYKISLDVYIK